MTRKHIAAFALLAAALPAPAFRVGVTADHLKAEINDRPVAVAIVHSCTDGEGYTGEAKLTCGGMKGRPVGFETEKDREAVFEDVARLFPLQPGTHAFEGEVVLTDTGGGFRDGRFPPLEDGQGGALEPLRDRPVGRDAPRGGTLRGHAPVRALGHHGGAVGGEP